MKAVIWPTWMSPLSTRSPPNHHTPTVEAFMMSMTIGTSSEKKVPIRKPRSMSDWLAVSKRLRSRRSRTKARMTRMPLSCSRTTWLMRSMLLWFFRKAGVIWRMMAPTRTMRTATATATIHDRPMSSRRAMMTAPTMVNGAPRIMMQVMRMSCWTCCTSLVVRVMSEGAPKWSTSWLE